MELEGILLRLNSPNTQDYGNINKAHSDILKWIEERLPPRGNCFSECETTYCLGYDTAWNAYRQQALKNLGIKEN